MKRIAFTNRKGGASKTTTLALLASYFADKGYFIAIDDRDFNEDATTFVQNVQENGVDNIELYKPENLKRYDYCFIDCPGGMVDEKYEKLHKESDIIIIPVRLEELEIKNSAKTGLLFKDISKVRHLLTRLDRSASEYSQIRNVRASLRVKTLRTIIHKKTQYPRVIFEGFSALKKDGMEEIEALAKEINKII